MTTSPHHRAADTAADTAADAAACASTARVLALLPPVVWAGLAGWTQLALARQTPRWRAGTPIAAAANAVAGAVGLGATALGAGAVADFIRRRTTVNPHAPDRTSTLVTSGPLRWSRNPMYLALAGGLTATAIASRAPAAFLPVAAFVAVMDAGQIRLEEDALEARFGAEYAAYRARVRRWC